MMYLRKIRIYAPISSHPYSHLTSISFTPRCISVAAEVAAQRGTNAGVPSSATFSSVEHYSPKCQSKSDSATHHPSVSDVALGKRTKRAKGTRRESSQRGNADKGSKGDKGDQGDKGDDGAKGNRHESSQVAMPATNNTPDQTHSPT
eukprot:gene1448-12573_t